MDDGILFECVVRPPENYPKTRRRKIRLIIFYCVFCALPLPLVFLLGDLKYLIPLVPVTGLLCFAFVKLTWYKTRPEYEYSLVGSEFTLSVIYGGRSRRTLFETDVRDASAILPVKTCGTRIRDFAPSETFSGVFTDDQINYYILTETDGGTHVAVALSAPPDLVKTFKRVNGRTVVSFD